MHRRGVTRDVATIALFFFFRGVIGSGDNARCRFYVSMFPVFGKLAPRDARLAGVNHGSLRPLSRACRSQAFIPLSALPIGASECSMSLLLVANPYVRQTSSSLIRLPEHSTHARANRERNKTPRPEEKKLRVADEVRVPGRVRFYRAESTAAI